MKNIHHLYVDHLLSGKGYVSSGGSVLTFVPVQAGSGWFGDTARSAWGHTKRFFNNHVKPVILSQGKDALEGIGQVLRQNAREVVRNDLLSDQPMSIKQRLAKSRATLKEGLGHDLSNLKNDHRRLLREHLLNQLR